MLAAILSNKELTFIPFIPSLNFDKKEVGTDIPDEFAFELCGRKWKSIRELMTKRR